MSNDTNTIEIRLLSGERRSVPLYQLPPHVRANAIARRLQFLAECKHGDAKCPRGKSGCHFVHPSTLLRVDAPATDGNIVELPPALVPPPLPHVEVVELPPRREHTEEPPVVAPAAAGVSDEDASVSTSSSSSEICVKVRRVSHGRGQFDTIPLSQLIANPASAYLTSQPNAVGRECRGHAPRSTITDATCRFVHFKTTDAAPSDVPAAAAAAAAAAAIVAPKVAVPPASPLCCVCDDHCEEERLPHVVCQRGHRSCGSCLASYVRISWTDKVSADNIGVMPEVRCLTAGCDDATPLRPAQLARAIAMSTEDADSAEHCIDIFLQAQQAARDAKTMAEVAQLVKQNEAQAQHWRTQLENAALAKVIGRHAYACKKCGYAPILLDGCSDIQSHHGQKVGKHVISNACPQCHNHTATIEDGFRRWDGEVRRTEEERQVYLDAQRARAAAGAGGRGRGRGRGGPRGGRGGRGFGRGRGAPPRGGAAN